MVGTLQMDLLVLALACNLTQFCTLRWSNGISAIPELARVTHWCGAQYVYLLRKLKEIRDGNGTAKHLWKGGETSCSAPFNQNVCSGNVRARVATQAPMRPCALVLGAVVGGCIGSVGSSDMPEERSPGTADVTPKTAGTGGNAGPTGMPSTTVGSVPTLPATATPPTAAAAPGTGFICDPKLVAAGPVRLWRLTDRQYARTVAALLDGRSRDANRELTPPAGISFPFGFVDDNDRFSTSAVSYRIDDLSFQNAMTAADKVSAKLVASLSGSCLAQGAFGSCMESLVADRGAVLFRRPLTREEVIKYAGLATKFEPMVGRSAAAEHAFQAMLMAPQFLFRAELGEDRAGRLMLSPHEIAAALSYGLTDGPPDEPLWADASNGVLADRTNIEKHAMRLLGAAVYTEAVARFVREYFRYGATREIAKAEKFHDAEGLVRDTDAFVRGILADGSRRDFLKTLLTSPMVYVSKSTAGSYGRASTALMPERVALDAQRFGMLTQPAWLTSFSRPEMTDPIRRGRFVQESLLCGHIPEISIDEIPMIPTDANRTLRAKLAIHTENPTCRVCHDRMDPIGLGFEGFDHYGRVRTTEAGKPVDTSGDLVGSGDRDGAFKTARELTDRLASSRAVTECFVAHAFQYWLGRAADRNDSCTLAGAVGAYDSGGGDLTAIVKTFFTSDSFLVRKL